MKFFYNVFVVCLCLLLLGYLAISVFNKEPSASPDQIHQICLMAEKCPECFLYLNGTYELNGYLGQSELILMQRAHKRHIEAEQEAKKQAAIDEAMEEVKKLLYKGQSK